MFPNTHTRGEEGDTLAKGAHLKRMGMRRFAAMDSRRYSLYDSLNEKLSSFYIPMAFRYI